MAASVGRISGSGAVTLSLSQGLNATADLSGTGTIASADMSLVVALLATLAGTGSISSADLAAVQNMQATLSGTGTLSNADMDLLIGITADLIGTGALNGSFTGLAHMSADISPFTELSPENLATAVWAAVATDNNDSGSMGEKLNNAAGGATPALTLGQFIALK